MPAATITNGLRAAYQVLGDFIVDILGATTTGQVFQGFGNRVAMPLTNLGGFVVMSQISKKRLSTNIDTYSGTSSPAPAPGPKTMELKQQADIQIDVYGPNASDWSDILVATLRDQVGYDALDPVCAPLYADDPVRGPLTDEELQYEDRQIVTLRLQYNAIVTTQQTYATVLGPVGIVDVDAEYPPE